MPQPHYGRAVGGLAVKSQELLALAALMAAQGTLDALAKACDEAGYGSEVRAGLEQAQAGLLYVYELIVHTK